MKPVSVLILTILFTTILLSSTLADDYTRWELPEGAKFRLGKGKIANKEGYLTTVGKGNSYQFSADDNKLAVITSIGVWLYDAMTGKEISLSRMNGVSIDGIVLSPDLQLCASMRDHQIDVWDLNTNQIKTTLEGHSNSVLSVSFSSDGKMLASTSFSNEIRLWNLENGKVGVITTTHKIVSRTMFSPDGKLILSGRRPEVLVWDIESGRFIAKLKETEGFYNIIFNKDGSVLFALSRSEARFWDPYTGLVKLRIKFESDYRRPHALSPDGKTLAIGQTKDNAVQLWDTQTGQLINTLSGNSRNVKMLFIANGIPTIANFPTRIVSSIAFSPDGRTLAVSSGGEIVFWNLEDGQPEFILKENEYFYYLMFSPDGRTLAARCNVTRAGSNIYLWNIDMENIKKSGRSHIIKDHNLEVSSIVFNNDGNILASGHHLEKIKLWDVVNARLKSTCNGYPYQLYVQSLVFVPHGRTLASLNLNTQSSIGKAEILFWNAETGEHQKTQKGHGKPIGTTLHISHGGGIAYYKEGNIFVTGSSDGSVRIWDAKAAETNSVLQRFFGIFFGPQKAKLRGHTDQVTTVALSPDGRIAASGSMDKTICLWDVRKRKLITTLEGHTREIQTVTFSPDGLTLASGGRDGSIHLWNATTGKHKISLIGNELFESAPSLPRRDDDPPYITSRGRSRVSSLIFSHDGKTLANGNGDGSIHFWDMSTYKITSSFAGQPGLSSLAYSPDGHTIASGSLDGTILIWTLE